MDMSWTPSESVGPFPFGSQLTAVANESAVEEIPEEFDRDVGWRVFRLSGNDDVRIYTENGAIQAVACERVCLHEGVDLIGLSLAEFERHLGAVHQEEAEPIELDSGIMEVYEFDSLGAQAWLEDGLIVTLILSAVGG